MVGGRGVDPCAMPLTERFEQALVFAAQLHKEQRRKGSGVPYVSHLLSVAGLVIEHGGDEDEAIAALLHDAIEDQGGAEARKEIRRRFGDRVTEIVDGCTDADTNPKPRWQERKETYIERLSTASPSVRLVSAADKLHNARSVLHDYRTVREEVWLRFQGGRDGTLWYYRAVTDALLDGAPTPLVEELNRVVTALEDAAGEGR